MHGYTSATSTITTVIVPSPWDPGAIAVPGCLIPGSMLHRLSLLVCQDWCQEGSPHLEFPPKDQEKKKEKKEEDLAASTCQDSSNPSLCCHT